MLGGTALTSAFVSACFYIATTFVMNIWGWAIAAARRRV